MATVEKMPFSFEVLLERSGLTKAKLSRDLGLAPTTVSRWGNDAPKYAMEYLRLLIELNRYRP